MDKEKIITIALGLVVGIVLAGGYFFGSKFLPKLTPAKKPTSPVANSKTQPSVSKKDQPPKDITLEVQTPQDNSSVTENKIKVIGSFLPNSTIFLYSNADEKIASANARGQFSFDTTLEDGENEITVSTLSQDQLISVKRNVTLEINQ